MDPSAPLQDEIGDIGGILVYDDGETEEMEYTIYREPWGQPQTLLEPGQPQKYTYRYWAEHWGDKMALTIPGEEGFEKGHPAVDRKTGWIVYYPSAKELAEQIARIIDMSEEESQVDLWAGNEEEQLLRASDLEHLFEAELVLPSWARTNPFPADWPKDPPPEMVAKTADNLFLLVKDAGHDAPTRSYFHGIKDLIVDGDVRLKRISDILWEGGIDWWMEEDDDGITDAAFDNKTRFDDAVEAFMLENGMIGPKAISTFQKEA